MDLYVFSPSLEPLGVLNLVSDLTWETAAVSPGNWEVWCSLTKDNLGLAAKDNVVCLDEEPESAGIIEFINLVSDSSGLTKLHMSGRTCEIYLDFRVIYPTYNAQGKLSDSLDSLVDLHLINPVDSQRKISTISLDPLRQIGLGPNIRWQKTGGTVLDAVQQRCISNSLRFRLRFSKEDKKLYFSCSETQDRSIHQSELPVVIISSDLDDILESEYTINTLEYKNTAYIAGEDSGTERKSAITGTGYGVFRKELYVDARDLQSNTEDGQMTEEEYEEALIDRGKSSLSEHISQEVFTASIRLNRNTYTYGTDFFLGDIVTVYDGRLNVSVDAIVSSSVLIYNSGQQYRDFVFGFSQPTISEKLKRR